MSKYISLLMVALSIGVAACLVLWFGAPGLTTKALLSLNARSAGLTHKTVQTIHGEIHYLEGGEGPRVLLVHGIYARKDHWVDMARYLVDDYHVIAVDLPGFGDNQVLPIGGYELDKQAKGLASLMDALGWETAHIGANSMGAQLAARLVRDHPKRVDTLALIGSPLGVKTKEPSDMIRALEDGHRPLVVRTEEQFYARNAWLFPEQPYVPGPVLKTFAKEAVAQAQVNDRIWAEVSTPTGLISLVDLAPRIKQRTWVWWCSDDRIFHPSGAKMLGDALRDSVVQTPAGCGHVPMMDKPFETAEAYGRFLGGA